MDDYSTSADFPKYKRSKFGLPTVGNCDRSLNKIGTCSKKEVDQKKFSTAQCCATRSITLSFGM